MPIRPATILARLRIAWTPVHVAIDDLVNVQPPQIVEVGDRREYSRRGAVNTDITNGTTLLGIYPVMTAPRSTEVKAPEPSGALRSPQLRLLLGDGVDLVARDTIALVTIE